MRRGIRPPRFCQSQMLDHMNVGQGDIVFAIEVEDGVLLTPYDPTFADAMESFRRGMQNVSERHEGACE